MDCMNGKYLEFSDEVICGWVLLVESETGVVEDGGWLVNLTRVEYDLNSLRHSLKELVLALHTNAVKSTIVHI